MLRSTLDASVQRIAVEALHRQLSGVRDQHVQDGAAVVVDTATGEVLAYVGSGGALSSARFVDGVQARRQAGSTLKPFLYATALDERLLTPASLLDDSPLEIAVAGGGLYRPQNYDERFRGPVSVRTALASSLNVPAVRALGLVGEEAFAARLRRLGFDLRESGEHYGPALALGSGDVSLWELVGAYRALATGGAWTPLRLSPDEPVPPARPVFSAAAAYVVADILADREARSATFGLESPLATRFWTAVKTGTSRDMRDNWCVGFSGRYTVGVWVGNFAGDPMWNVSGVTGAAPAWLEIMSRLHAGVPAQAPPRPSGLVAVPVRFAGGVEAPRGEWFLRGTEPRRADVPSPLSGQPGRAENGSTQQASARALAADPAPPDAGAAIPGSPVAAVTVAPALGRARIVAPSPGTIVAIDPGIPASRQRMLFEARPGAEPVRFSLDGADLGPAGAPLLWSPRPGRHRLELVDADGRVHDASHFQVRGPRE